MHRVLNKHVVQLVAANPSPMTASGTNCYLIGSGQKRTLIDTGSPGTGKSCLAALDGYQKLIRKGTIFSFLATKFIYQYSINTLRRERTHFLDKVITSTENVVLK